MEIEQRYVIAFLYRNNKSAGDISKILEDTYHDDCYRIDTVRYWLREIKSGRTTLHEFEPIEKLKDDGVTSAIERMIERNPLMSARMIARSLGVSPTTVINRLRDELDYHFYKTKWIPHQINSHQKMKRVHIAQSMLSILSEDEKHGFKNIYTGDESWFLFEYSQSSQWVLSKDELLTRTRKTNMQQKVMITIFFNGSGPILIDYLPKGMKFNGEYFINIIQQISDKVYPHGRRKYERKKTLHYDNSPCHKSKKVKSFLSTTEFKTMKHPPYSPDIAPSDFGLFGTVKEKMINTEHANVQELQSHINEILYSFSEKFWKSLFLEWKRRLMKVIECNGDYFE